MSYYKAEDVINIIEECIAKQEMLDSLDHIPTITVSKDAISRGNVIKALRLEYPSMPLFKELRDEWQLKSEGYLKAEEIIRNAPSVEEETDTNCTE